ncbi:hypothetical protein [Parafrankia sp. BMG5.11]|uniref:hypothetical protein n=1 Tax=Parafrankia sp. BMG5.11 TaxID=222540 RepID=UPI001038B596|nr:hypothetical protein [Parafrankia sp. BMG5.11]TCJ31578.1 hypothetical protein E0504_47640 [Parafrankia sp. BMG5.11]
MPLPGGDADRHFYSTDEISAAGTWDYCEATASVNGQALRTEAIAAAHRPVRVCLRRDGGLQCANLWYADTNDKNWVIF